MTRALMKVTVALQGLRVRGSRPQLMRTTLSSVPANNTAPPMSALLPPDPQGGTRTGRFSLAILDTLRSRYRFPGRNKVLVLKNLAHTDQ